MSRDFVRRLLSEDASLRSTAEEALQLFLKKREKMMMMMFILLKMKRVKMSMFLTHITP